MSRPSETANSAPTTTRGIAFAPLIYGPRTSHSRGLRPSTTPKMTPNTEPTTKPPTVSSIVTRTCSHRGPRSVPSVNQRHNVAAMSEGCDQKNLSITVARAPSSQPPRITTATSTRPAMTLSCLRRASRRLRPARSGLVRTACSPNALTALSRAALLTLVAHEDLIAEVLPDLFVNLDKAGLKTDLGDVARTRQVDLVGALDRARSSRDDEHAVAERDRLFEVMGHEDDRRGGGRPQVEQLVFHQRPCLHIEGAEGFVHEQDPGPVDQALSEGDALAHAARQLIRVAVLEAGEANTRDPVASPLPRVAVGNTPIARPRRHVLEHGLPGEDRVGLEHVTDALGDADNRLAEDLDLTLARRLQAGDESERGRLPASGGPDHGAELARLNLEVQVSQRGVNAARGREESLGDTAKLDGGGHLFALCEACPAGSRHAVVMAVLVVLVAGRHRGDVLRSRASSAVKTRLPLAYQILVFQAAILLLS